MGNTTERSKQGRRQNNKHEAAHNVGFYFQTDLLRAALNPPKDTRVHLGGMSLMTPDKTLIKDQNPSCSLWGPCNTAGS